MLSGYFLTHLGLYFAWDEWVDNDNDAFEMICTMTIFGGLFLIICYWLTVPLYICTGGVRFLLWVPLLDNIQWIDWWRNGDEAFDWSVAVHSVVHDIQRASLLPCIGTWLRCHRCCIHMYFVTKLVQSYGRNYIVMKIDFWNSEEFFRPRRSPAVWILMFYHNHSMTVVMCSKKTSLIPQQWLFVVISSKWHTIF